jgi:hypothetical protein
MLDLITITDESGLSTTSPRDIPQYDPTERAYRGDPMQYGAYRRWKLAENQDTKKSSRGKKKPKSGNNDFFNSIKNLGKSNKDGKNLGQGFGTRAEPPPNKASITPKKPIAKKNKKRVITPGN